MRYCLHCDKELPKPKPGKRRLYCSISHKMAYYRTGTPKYIARHKVIRKRYNRKRNVFRKEARIWVSQLKVAKGCSFCGFNDHPVALDFHHVKGNKIAPVSYLVRRVGADKPYKEVEEEIKKCIVLCSNCHRIETFNKTTPQAN